MRVCSGSLHGLYGFVTWAIDARTSFHSCEWRCGSGEGDGEHWEKRTAINTVEKKTRDGLTRTRGGLVQLKQKFFDHS